MRLFFPEHDMALACGVRHYNAPRMALDLAARGEALATWWQRPGEGPIPWGWDWDSRAELRRAGIPAAQLPTDDELHLIRRLSSREQTIAILSTLRPLCPAIALPERLDSEAALDTWLALHEGDSYVLKSPWSSSGRGLARHNGGDTAVGEAEAVGGAAAPPQPTKDTAALRRHALRVIRQQGCVLAEPWYHRLQDFAMLFFIDRRRRVSFEGYSLFDNDPRGTYLRGRLASNGDIEATLRSVCGDAIAAPSSTPPLSPSSALPLHAVRDVLLAWLAEAVSPFRSDFPLGWVGIDMMVIEADGRPVLHPCVEMNLRATMGVVARNMFDRDGKTGFFSFKKTD